MRRPRARFPTAPLALLALLALGCPRRAAPPAREPAARDAAAPDPLPRAEPALPPPAEPALPAQSFTDEPPRAYAPGAPPGCELVPPVRQLALPAGAPTVFATAVAPRFALLAVSVGPTDHSAADALVITLPRDASAPSFARAPLEPGALTLAAAASADRVLLAWTRPEPDESAPLRVRFAWLPLPEHDAGAAAPAARTLARRPEARVSDLACDDAACTLAWGYAEPGAPESASARAAFTLLRPDAPDAPAPTRLAPPGASPANALPPDAPDFRGTALRGAGAELVPARAGDPPVALPLAPLDLARAAGGTYALTATAPGSEPCQPGAWRAELARLSPAGALVEPAPVAVADARPRGARIRDAGGGALITWLDAPQCAADFFVIRARRGESVAALATAQDYDVAAAGEDVSLVLRDRDRLRWVRYRCPRGTPPR